MNKYKKLFPFFKFNKEVTYLDSAATGLKLKEAIHAEANYLIKNGANVGRGMYDEAMAATNLYEEARTDIAKFLGANSDEIIFTTGTTEGLNLAAYILSRNLGKNDNVIISHMEHNSSILPWLKYAEEIGFKIKFLPFDKHGLIIDELANLVDNNTKVVVISLASNVLGSTPDLKKIEAILENKDVYLLCDGAQYVGHNKLDLKNQRIDFLAFSGHKMYATNGIGVLYIKNNPNLKLTPYKVGGGMIDGYLEVNKPRYLKAPHLYEAGTPLIGQALSLAKAINILDQINLDNIKKQEDELLTYALEKIKAISEVEIINDMPTNPIISFIVKDVHSHDMASFFANKKISMRAGFHCAEQLLKELGYNMGCLRISFAFYNTFEDIDNFVKVLKEAISYFKR